jgi:hypothetical protein
MNAEADDRFNLDADMKDRAMVLAMTIRNAMEGRLHGGALGDLSLTDEQMAMLNPIIRNGILTGLHAERNCLTNLGARKYLNFQRTLVPEYWEEPELLDDYVDFLESTPDSSEPNCRRCGRAILAMSSRQRGSFWTHITAGGSGTNVGCRAASWVEGNGWDENLPRSWKAAPPPAT